MLQSLISFFNPANQNTASGQCPGSLPCDMANNQLVDFQDLLKTLVAGIKGKQNTLKENQMFVAGTVQFDELKSGSKEAGHGTLLGLRLKTEKSGPMKKTGSELEVNVISPMQIVLNPNSASECNDVELGQIVKEGSVEVTQNTDIQASKESGMLSGVMTMPFEWVDSVKTEQSGLSLQTEMDGNKAKVKSIQTKGEDPALTENKNQAKTGAVPSLQSSNLMDKNEGTNDLLNNIDSIGQKTKRKGAALTPKPQVEEISAKQADLNTKGSGPIDLSTLKMESVSEMLDPAAKQTKVRNATLGKAPHMQMGESETESMTINSVEGGQSEGQGSLTDSENNSGGSKNFSTSTVLDAIHGKGNVQNQKSETVGKAAAATFASRLAEASTPNLKDSVINQVLPSMIQAVREGTARIRLALHPQELGTMRMELVSEKGMVDAKMMVESQEVKEIVEQSLPELRNGLAKENIQIQQFDVSVNRDENREPLFDRETQSQSDNETQSSDGDSNHSETKESDSAPGMNPREYGYNSIEIIA